MLPVCFLNASENPCKYNLDAERRTISQLVVNVQQLAYESHCTQIEDRAIYNGLIEADEVTEEGVVGREDEVPVGLVKSS